MKILKTVIFFIITISIIIILSIISNRIWKTKSEKIVIPETLIINTDMTVKEFGIKNNIPNQLLKKIFGLKKKSDIDKKITEFHTADTAEKILKQKLALISENSSKNWIKIFIKFICWSIFLIFTFIFLGKRKINSKVRSFLQIAAILLFGIVLGSDPSPMGTVKDAVFLFGSFRTVFFPRLIAFGIFIIMVIFVNKYICSWGCQAGVLQDFLFGLNKNKQNKPIIWNQFKIPFAVTNSIRIIVFLALILVSFILVFDIIEPIDIFKIFNPEKLGIIGIVFISLILISSLFIYRPWCHMICPFGLIGWIFEKISIVKINVDYNTCISCKKCLSACPSTVMGAILLRNKKVIPDCFSCYRCRDICPTNSIKFSANKREKPGPNKFT